MREGGRPGRPATILAALVLTTLTGAANVLVGVVVLVLLRTHAVPAGSGLSASTLRPLAWGYLVLGTVTLAGARALAVRGRGSRAFVTAVMLLRIAVACLSFGLVGTWYSGGSVAGIVIAVVVIGLLWDSHANAYFHTPRA